MMICNRNPRLMSWATRILSIASMLMGVAPLANASDIRRVMAAEIDPVAPVAAMSISNKNERASMYGGLVDFNVGNVATGPELWVGNFSKKGDAIADDAADAASQKIEAMRLRWTVSYWEKPSSLRGWFLKGGYSYTSIHGRSDTGFTPIALDNGFVPSAESDIIETRHGLIAGFGQRWTFWDQAATVTLTLSATFNLKQDRVVDSDNETAEKNYEETIEKTPYAKMSKKAVPEASLTLGYLL